MIDEKTLDKINQKLPFGYVMGMRNGALELHVYDRDFPEGVCTERAVETLNIYLGKWDFSLKSVFE